VKDGDDDCVQVNTKRQAYRRPCPSQYFMIGIVNPGKRRAKSCGGRLVY
jgi:hypothetical protein